MTANSKATERTRCRRWPYILLGIFLCLAGSLWGGYEWATAKAETTLNQRLAERSLYLSYSSRSWIPWRGLSLNDVELFQDASRSRPIFALSRLDVDFPWREMARSGEFLSRWRTDDAKLSLHDDRGEVILDHVTVDAVVRPGEVEFTRLDIQNGPRIFELSGKLQLRPKDEAKKPRDFVLDLDAMRAVFGTLNFTEDRGTFLVKGTLHLDARETPVAWNADLTGNGTDVVWHGQPLRQAAVVAELSNAGMKGSARLGLAKGSAQLNLALEDWEGAPLALSGQVVDSANRADKLSAAYHGKSRTLSIQELAGNADVLELLHNIPELAPHLPAWLHFRTPPELAVRDFTWQSSPPSWSLGLLQLHSPADVVLKVDGNEVAVNQLKGSASYAEGSWKLSDISARTLGGSLKLDGVYERAVLHKAAVALDGLHMAQLSPWLGGNEGGFGRAVITLNYSGQVGTEAEQLSGSGRVQIENAPIVRVPLLDETYTLFSALIPGVRREGVGEMRGKFTAKSGVVTFSSFEATGGSLAVSAAGSLDLPAHRVSARARGKLRGIEGVVTSPLSRLLEMEVSGPLDDIRVRPVGPVRLASATVSGTVGVATDTVVEAGKVTGTVVKEGVKLPFRVLGIFKKKKK